MVFENLKATFCEHLMHTRFISRKVGFSRRCRICSSWPTMRTLTISALIQISSGFNLLNGNEKGAVFEAAPFRVRG
jgi:hypothetical protein